MKIEQSIFSIQTQIAPSVKKKVFFRGFLLAAVGASMLFIVGNFASVAQLKTWGLISFFLGMFFIRAGLLPFKRLSKQEIFPNKLFLISTSLIFQKKNKLALSIPLDEIEKLEFFESKNMYGIQLHLKEGKILDPKHRFFHRKSLRKWNCDYFFAFFSKSSFDSIQSTLQDVMHP